MLVLEFYDTRTTVQKCCARRVLVDVQSNELYDAAAKAADAALGFTTHSLICVPIRSVSRMVIGVFHLVNKQPEEGGAAAAGDATAFSQNDAEMLEAVAVFAGIAISNTKLYESAMRAIAKQQVALEVLSYHATAPAEEALRLKVRPSSTFSRIVVLFLFETPPLPLVLF